MQRLLLLILVFLGIAAFSIPSTATELGDCDPLDPSRCYLPSPNDFWLRETGSGTGKRLSFSRDVFPKDELGKPIDAELGGWNALDGWPAITPIMAFFPDVDLDGSRVANSSFPGTSIAPGSPITLLDTSDASKQPHWGELDYSSGDEHDGFDQVLMIWPTRRLKDSTRYIVAIHGLVDHSGRPIQPSEAFKALRDNIPTNDPNVELRRSKFESIFASLRQAGVERSSLQLAWDFTTASQEGITGRLIHMRDDAWRQIKEQRGSIQYKIRSVSENPGDRIARIVEASIEVPQYVDKQEPGARLVLDSSGLPVFQKFAWADVTIQIPRSLAEEPMTKNASIMQYGHGLFGRRGESTGSYLQQMAFEQRSIIVASDWIGLSSEDQVPVALMIMDDLTKFGMVPDRSLQGMLRALVLMRLFVEGNILKDPAMTFNGRPIVTPEVQRYYYGNSQGGILGSVYMAVSQDVRRGCLGVGGGPYVMLLPRSIDFTVLFEFLKSRYHDAIDRIFLLSMIQMLWDRAAPGGFMSVMTSDRLPNTPPHEILFQHALGDAQVTQLGTYIQGRSLDAQMFVSNVHEPYDSHFGFEMIPDTAVGRKAFVQTYRYKTVPPIPIENVPPPQEFDPHGWVRKHPTAIEQMWRFFRTGEIVNTCGGGCDNLDPP